MSTRALYLGLIGREHLSPRVRSDLERFQRDASTIKVDWTLDAPIPWSAPHARRAGTVHLASGMDELSRTMNEITCGLLPRDPFLVMGQYAVTDPTRQPPGRDTAWAYTHVPQQPRGDAAGELSGDLMRELDAFADRMQARVEACAPGFTARIRQRRIAGPHDLQATNRSLVGGDINGGTAQLHQLALFRPIPAQLGRPGHLCAACIWPRHRRIRRAACTAPRRDRRAGRAAARNADRRDRGAARRRAPRDRPFRLMGDRLLERAPGVLTCDLCPQSDSGRAGQMVPPAAIGYRSHVTEHVARADPAGGVRPPDRER